ncbi:hypothetical protein [Halanaerobium praevalens]|uniref:hypothetical protein n=1 Tax=Halanaerobium praevalens TaxID=2331 RepID=UPI0002DCA50C|nr:hypothetical protein [Halanaerobium praevalens]
MGYNSSRGKRPIEYASKASHSQIINNKNVKELIKKLNLPKGRQEFNLADDLVIDVLEKDINKIKTVFTVDGGYTDVSVKDDFPSAMIAFFK